MKVQNHLRDAFKEERIQGVNLCKERYKMIGNWCFIIKRKIIACSEAWQFYLRNPKAEQEAVLQREGE